MGRKKDFCYHFLQTREKKSMDKTTFPYGLIYGPHASRRLGLSLGVDLAPMTCTFNCVYCERGRTAFGCKNQAEFATKVSMEAFSDALKQKMKAVTRVDCLTFSGTGEPALEPRLGEFIASAREIVGQMPIKVITNSSLLTQDGVIENLVEADEVIAKLNTVSDDIFAEMHRTFDEAMNVEIILKGLHALKRKIGNKLTIEILFVRSYQPVKTNSTSEEVAKLTEALRELEPARVHIHTVSRFPAEPYILPVDRRFIETTSTYMRNRLPKTNFVISLNTK